jgi:hypothetical protein
VNWFSEKLWGCYCLDEDADCDALFEQYNVTDKFGCQDHPDLFEWANLQWNFDTVLNGLHTMFTVSTLSGNYISICVLKFLLRCFVKEKQILFFDKI